MNGLLVTAIVLALLGILAAIVILFVVLRKINNKAPEENREIIDQIKTSCLDNEKQIKEARMELQQEIKSSRQETIQFTQTSFRSLAEILSGNQKDSAGAQDKRLAELNRQFEAMAIQNEQKLENIRNTMEKRISALQEDNSKQLEQMRHTVDEKLQKTLEERIGQSFRLVSERLEQVYKGLGEMQTLAAGVGDLKKVLSNVKTRGILGAVKTEFDKFGDVLAMTQQRINQANVELDKLIGVRTRSIQRKLRNVVSIAENESTMVLDVEPQDIEVDPLLIGIEEE